MKSFALRSIALATAIACTITMTGCGTLTGIPGHGGGKRFATEQQLVSASVRSTLLEIDVSALKGKKVALVFDFMSDEGGGQMVGGRASIGMALSAASVVSPITTTSNVFQVFDLINKSTSSSYSNTSGGVDSTTTTTGVLSGVGTSTSSGTSTGTDNGTNSSTSTGTTVIGGTTTTGSNTNTGTTTTQPVTTTTTVGGGSSTTTYPGTTTTTTTGPTTTTQTTPPSTVTTTTAPSTNTNTTGTVTTGSTGSGTNTSTTGPSTNTSTGTTTGTNTNTSTGSTTGTGSSTQNQNTSGTQTTGSTNYQNTNSGGSSNGMQQQVMVSGQTSQTKGQEKRAQLDIVYKGLGDYQTIAVPKSDASFLMGQVRNYLLLSGVHVTTPQDPALEAVVYVSVDIFGLVRSRFDAFVYNNETVRAETGIEMMAFDKATGKLIMPPRNASMQAAYKEHYMFWVGPMESDKKVSKAEGLLVNFSDVVEKKAAENTKARQEKDAKADNKPEKKE